MAWGKYRIAVFATRNRAFDVDDSDDDYYVDDDDDYVDDIDDDYCC